YETRLFPEPEYTFKHALTHEVAYGGLLQERRRTLHARIVTALEALAGDRGVLCARAGRSPAFAQRARHSKAGHRPAARPPHVPHVARRAQTRPRPPARGGNACYRSRRPPSTGPRLWHDDLDVVDGGRQ